MNFAQSQGDRQPELAERNGGQLTRRERQIAFAIGTIAGGAGGTAVFTSSNQAGTILLLLIALVFLLVSVEGTPLLWHAVKPGNHRPGKRRLDKAAQRIPAKIPPQGVGMADDMPMADQVLVRPAISPTGPDDDGGPYRSE